MSTPEQDRPDRLTEIKARAAASDDFRREDVAWLVRELEVLRAYAYAAADQLRRQNERWENRTPTQAAYNGACAEVERLRAALAGLLARCDERESRREWLDEHAEWLPISEIRDALALPAKDGAP